MGAERGGGSEWEREGLGFSSGGEKSKVAEALRPEPCLDPTGQLDPDAVQPGYRRRSRWLVLDFWSYAFF